MRDCTPDEFLFVRSDGSWWKRSDQTRPIKDALKMNGWSCPRREHLRSTAHLRFPRYRGGRAAQRHSRQLRDQRPRGVISAYR
jgi:hypothetical protein